MKKLLLALCVFALLVSSCDWLFEDYSGNTKTFYAMDFSNGKFYQLRAELLAVGADPRGDGRGCEVWVERGAGISKETAQRVANAYSNDIFPKMMNSLGWKDSETGYNVMQISNMLGSNSGRLTILLLDIRDDYKEGVNEAYVGGYFHVYNYFIDNRSNECDMIYMDINPSVVGSPEFYGTLAHELQHLMNFISTVWFRSEINSAGEISDLFFMDTWIDEGLSESAEWIYSGKPNQDRIHWFANNGFNDDVRGSIDKGNNFFTWGSRNSENFYAVLDDYASVNVFFQWLRLHSDENIYFKIITSEHSNYNAVTEGFDKSTPWSVLLETWHTANFIKHNNNRHGYKNNVDFKDIKAHYINVNTIDNKWDLYPGEGVYSFTETYIKPPFVNPIKYEYLEAEDRKALLTLNVDTNNDINNGGGKKTPGDITGVPPPLPAQVSVSASRSVGSSFGPYRVGAGDILNRNGQGANLSLFTANSNRAAATEVKPFPFDISKMNIERYGETRNE